MVASMRSGRRSFRPRWRSIEKAWGEVTSCTKCVSMYSTAGVSGVSGTTSCASQTFSNIVFMGVTGSECGCGGRSGAAIHINIVEPAPLIMGRARKQSEEGALQFFRDGTSVPRADRDAVDRADRRHFGGRAREEHF